VSKITNKGAEPQPKGGFKPVTPTKKKKIDWKPPVESYKPWYTLLLTGGIIIAGYFLLLILFNYLISIIVSSQNPDAASDVAKLSALVEAFRQKYGIISYIESALLPVWMGVVMIFIQKIENIHFTNVMAFANPKNKNINMGMGFVVAILAFVFVIGVIAMAGVIELKGITVSAETFLWWIFLLIIAISEEFVFRGYIPFKVYSALDFVNKVTVRKWATVFVSALLFALLKALMPYKAGWNTIALVSYFSLGVLLTYSRIALNSIWFSITFRMTWSMLVGGIFSLSPPISGIVGVVIKEDIVGTVIAGRFGCESGVAAIFAFLLCVIFVYNLTKTTDVPMRSKRLAEREEKKNKSVFKTTRIRKQRF